MWTKYRAVPTVDAYPLGAIVSVEVNFADGTWSRGTGAVVGRNDVLTAAHVVTPSAGQTIRAVYVTPGLDDGVAPWGSFRVSDWVHEWVDRGDDGHLSRTETSRDYAILTVRDPVPIGAVTGWFDIAFDAMTPGLPRRLESAGYPEELQKGSDLGMIRTVGPEVYDGRVLVHDIEFETGVYWGGGSGSPFWIDRGDRPPAIVGVLSTGWTAAYVDADVAADLAAWMARNDPQRLSGTAAGDTLTGGIAADRLTGRGGDDRLDGDRGNDRLGGNRGDDRLEGGPGRDRLSGGPGDDTLAGQRGADVLLAGPGDDLLVGGRGGDAFVFLANAGTSNRIRDFEPDIDRIVIEAAGGVRGFETLREGDDTRLLAGDVEVLLLRTHPADLTDVDILVV